MTGVSGSQDPDGEDYDAQHGRHDTDSAKKHTGIFASMVWNLSVDFTNLCYTLYLCLIFGQFRSEMFQFRG